MLNNKNSFRLINNPIRFYSSPLIELDSKTHLLNYIIDNEDFYSCGIIVVIVYGHEIKCFTRTTKCCKYFRKTDLIGTNKILVYCNTISIMVIS